MSFKSGFESRQRVVV